MPPAPDPLPPAPPTYKADAERQAALGRIGAVPERWVYDGDAFEPLSEPQPGDWLEDHPEAGQTVAAFVRAERRQPEGELVLTTFATERAVGDLAEILSVYLGGPVVARDLGVEVAGLPGRIHPDTGEPQLYTEALLDQLATRRPEGAWGVLGVTSVDLSPNADWNFVFGQARYAGGVGVFSTARHGPADPTTLLRRAVHTLTHEALHMMGMAHCPYWRCAMNGSNSLAESDRTPMHLCPVCLRKLVLATGVDPVARYEGLDAVYRKYGLLDAADFVCARLASEHGERPDAGTESSNHQCRRSVGAERQ